MDSLWSNIFKDDKMQKEHIINILKNIPIFQELGTRDLNCIERILHRRQYQSNEVIFNQGTLGAGMYILIQGHVKIIFEPSNKELATLSDGEFFGELALLDEAPRSATAVAQSPCIILGFFQADLFGLTERNPRLGSKIMLRLSRIIGKRLKHCNESVNDLQEENKRLRAELESLKVVQ